jgi:hypothetical protein
MITIRMIPIRGISMKKILPFLLMGVLTMSGFGAALSTQMESNEQILHNTIHFSEPIINDQRMYLSVQEKEATSYSAEPGNPVLPIYTKLFTFPFGTTIKDVTFTALSIQTIHLTKEIIPAAQPSPISSSQETTAQTKLVKNAQVYYSTQLYPTARLTYRVGTGLSGKDHVILVSVHYYPLLYSPQQRMLFSTSDVQITVTYELPQTLATPLYNNTLLIIAPEEFSAALQPLITHKTQYGFTTRLLTTELIAVQYPGRDLQEQIKYAIKDSIETNGTSYVLLVGGVEKIPIRRSYVTLFHDYDEKMITDLYYSDIYDAQGNFSSWDTNHNDKFGESSDKVDLYPDVHLGRLACDNLNDVNITVDKIIHYETETYGSNWFNTMIFIGGNTFRLSPGNDGEDNNKVIMGIMSQFTPKIIWTSKMNYNPVTITRAITNGAGFLDYSGHGFEHGMATYTPGGLRTKWYFTSYIKAQRNGYKLPIMFFDACLTAKIDFVLQDIWNYSTFNIIPRIFTALGVNSSMRLPCYAWAFVNHEGGGAIATIGATRTAYGGIDDGAGRMSVEFFSAYNNSQYLGEMITQMQNGYITDIHNDAFTVEEFILLGDPSLRIGGYPPQ